MAIAISLLALFATFYQLYLQRVHNEKSLKPLGQIDLRDRNNQIYVCVANNGMGPMLIDKFRFFKDGNQYNNIQDCLNLAHRSYRYILISDLVKKVILPNAFLEVFAREFDEHDGEEIKEIVRSQLTAIKLRVDCHDIYGNKFNFERDLEWFSRHASRKMTEDIGL